MRKKAYKSEHDGIKDVDHLRTKLKIKNTRPPQM
jgi:hypothetical protein